MKRILTVVMVLVSYFSHGQSTPRPTDEQEFNKCVLENTNYFTFDGQKPVGKGWTILEGLFAKNQFVAWGEYHNSPVLSKLTNFALESASKSGYKTWCIETSPFIASELTVFSKAKNTTDTILTIAKKFGIPFFRTKEDASMLIAANKFNYSIWGLDQEFQVTFPHCITKVYDSQPYKIRQKYKAVYDSLIAHWWWPKKILLDSLQKGIAELKYKSLLADVATGKKIMNDNDNLLRSSIMKNNFYSYYDKLKSKNEKVFFKMGNNHLARGLNLETKLYDIGNAVFELSQRNKTNFANVYLMVRYTMEGEKIIDDVEAKKRENPIVFSKLYDREKWVLVDVRSLREIMQSDNTLSIDTYKLIEKYDFVLVSPEILK